MQQQELGALQGEATAQGSQVDRLVVTLQQAPPCQGFQAPHMQTDRRWAFVQKARSRQELPKAHDRMKGAQQFNIDRFGHD
ncbi:hypothetical protein D3C86_1749470 [compost metagenome]